MHVHWNVAGLLCIYHDDCHYHFLVKPRHWAWGLHRGLNVGWFGIGPILYFCWFKKRKRLEGPTKDEQCSTSAP